MHARCAQRRRERGEIGDAEGDVVDPAVIAAEATVEDLRVGEGEYLECARALDGRLVVASFIAAKPAYTLRGFTMLGAAVRDDGVERGAVLKGTRLDVEEGKRLTVVGRLRVIEHQTDTVNSVIVPAWVEVRVQEVR